MLNHLTANSSRCSTVLMVSGSTKIAVRKRHIEESFGGKKVNKRPIINHFGIYSKITLQNAVEMIATKREILKQVTFVKQEK